MVLMEKLMAPPQQIVDWVDQLLSGVYEPLDDEEPDLIEDTETMGENAQALVDQFSALSPDDYERFSKLAHDLRGHVNGISGWAEIILQGMDGPINEAQQEIYAGIMRNGGFVLSQIDKVVDYSRQQIGDIRLKLRPFDLLSVIAQPFRFYNMMDPLPIELTLPEDTPSVMGDAMYFKLCLYHIIDNAFFHYGPSARPQVTVTVSHSPAWLFLDVIDDGQGLAPVHLPHIFEPFYQADSTMPGLGLGLAVARNYIDLMGGCVEAHSSSDTGTQVHITMPLA